MNPNWINRITVMKATSFQLKVNPLMSMLKADDAPQTSGHRISIFDVSLKIIANTIPRTININTAGKG